MVLYPRNFLETLQNQVTSTIWDAGESCSQGNFSPEARRAGVSIDYVCSRISALVNAQSFRHTEPVLTLPPSPSVCKAQFHSSAPSGYRASFIHVIKGWIGAIYWHTVFPYLLADSWHVFVIKTLGRRCVKCLSSAQISSASNEVIHLGSVSVSNPALQHMVEVTAVTGGWAVSRQGAEAVRITLFLP